MSNMSLMIAAVASFTACQIGTVCAESINRDADLKAAMESFRELEALRPSTVKLDKSIEIESSRAFFRWIVDVERTIDRHINLPAFISIEPLAQKNIAAYNITWYGFGNNGASDDVTVVQQKNFQRLWRSLAASGRTYTIHDVNVETGETRSMEFDLTGDEASSSITVHKTSDGFDLSAVPFMLAMKERTPGARRKIALKNSSNESGVELADLIEYGPVQYTDLGGNEHEAYRFALMRYKSDSWEAWDYYVTNKAPYWLGLKAWFPDGHITDISMIDYEVLETNVDEEYKEFVK